MAPGAHQSPGCRRGPINELDSRKSPCISVNFVATTKQPSPFITCSQNVRAQKVLLAAPRKTVFVLGLLQRAHTKLPVYYSINHGAGLVSIFPIIRETERKARTLLEDYRGLKVYEPIIISEEVNQCGMALGKRMGWGVVCVCVCVFRRSLRFR